MKAVRKLYLHLKFNKKTLSSKFYESYIIVDGNIDDNAVDEIIAKYKNLFAKNEVEVVNVDKIGRRRLAYPIRKKQNGFYICFEILALPGLMTKIERAYQLDENVLRYLSVHVTEKTKKEKEEHFKNKALIEEARQAELLKTQAKEEAPAAEVTETDKVEN